MNVHSAAFSIADDTLSISKPCSLATSARAIQRVTGPNALRFRCARLTTSLFAKPDWDAINSIKVGILPSARSIGMELLD